MASLPTKATGTRTHIDGSGSVRAVPVPPAIVLAGSGKVDGMPSPRARVGRSAEILAAAELGKRGYRDHCVELPLPQGRDRPDRQRRMTASSLSRSAASAAVSIGSPAESITPSKVQKLLRPRSSISWIKNSPMSPAGLMLWRSLPKTADAGSQPGSAQRVLAFSVRSEKPRDIIPQISSFLWNKLIINTSKRPISAS